MAFIGTTNVEDIVEGTYASDYLNTWTHDSLTGSVICDASGDLYIEQSPDGENWDVVNYSYNMYIANVSGNTAAISSNTPIAVTADSAWSFVEQLILPYVRVRFVTEGSPTVFRLHARTTDSGVKY